MTRLITMNITANQTFLFNIFIVLIIDWIQILSKHLIQFADKLLLTTHQVHQSAHILRDMEREIPRVAFNEPFTSGLLYIKRLFE